MDDIMRCHLTPSKNKSFVKNAKLVLELQTVWKTEEKRLRWCDVKSSVVEKCFPKIWQLLHTVLGVQKVNVWNRVKRHEVHEDTLQTEDETVPWHTIVSWRQNRFSTGEGQDIRINLSANYRLVTADISNNGESTTKYYNVIYYASGRTA